MLAIKQHRTDPHLGTAPKTRYSSFWMIIRLAFLTFEAIRERT